MKVIICADKLNVRDVHEISLTSSAQILSIFTCFLLLFYFHVSVASTAVDSTAYYLGANAGGVPNGAPPVQGQKQTYLVQVSDPPSTDQDIPLPACPANYVPQIYVVPVAFSGQVIAANAAVYSGFGGGVLQGIQPMYGVYAYAQQKKPFTGWQVSLSGIVPQGSNAVYMMENPLVMTGWVSVTTQCCNPNDPNSSKCQY